jgi:hypothetical protein
MMQARPHETRLVLLLQSPIQTNTFSSLNLLPCLYNCLGRKKVDRANFIFNAIFIEEAPGYAMTVAS